jgi:beta-glucosidase
MQHGPGLLRLIDVRVLEEAERSLVLLKNAAVGGGAPLLPLSPEVRDLALIGPLANDSPGMLGSWAGLGRHEDVAPLPAALAQRIGAEHLLQARGAGILDGSDADIATAVATAEKADVVLLALGEDAGSMTGEAASRSSLGLPGRQQELLEKVVATGKPVVLILFSGRPLTLPWAFEHVPAVLAAWFPGIQAGPALVATLFGDANPSGRLVVSWPRAVGQEPLYYNALNTGRPAAAFDLTKPPQGGGDEKYVSRYIDQQNTPQFPFGYGLSYTSFRYGATELSRHELQAAALNRGLRAGAGRGAAGPALTASADITNTGSRPGIEVVQLYVRVRGTSVAQPVRALAGFRRVALAPGETKRVSFELGPEALALWGDRQQFTVEPANATVWISPDSASGVGADITIAR